MMKKKKTPEEVEREKINRKRGAAKAGITKRLQALNDSCKLSQVQAELEYMKKNPDFSHKYPGLLTCGEIVEHYENFIENALILKKNDNFEA